MCRIKNAIKSVLAAIIALTIMFTVIIPDVKAAPIIPKLQMVTQPAAKYRIGERVSFTITSPNYGGKVEYRVILYNGTTKTTSELWKTANTGYYYKNWQPSGNYKFTINWPVIGMEPGAYSLTVLVRKVGTKLPYESFVKTNAFWIINETTVNNETPVINTTPESQPIQSYSNIITYMDMIKELSSDKYEGKKSGTDGYKAAAKLLENKLLNAGLVPLNDSSLIQVYSTGLTILQKEYFSINDKRLEIMKDYMPFSRGTSASYTGTRSMIFVGSGTESSYTGLDVKGKTVIFSWYDSNGKFPSGMTDRVLIAKNKGASEVLTICNGELKVGNYEHPLNIEDIGIYVQYISVEAAKTLGITDYSKVLQFSAKLEYNIQIKREKNVLSQNIVGMIKGRDNSKSILLTTNLDGFGNLPDGTIYQNAKFSAVSPAMFVELAAYYSKNQPEYNLIFAVVGNKWDSQDGIKQLMGKINSNETISAIELYSMGGSQSNPYIGISPKAEDSILNNVIKPLNGAINYDFGNALSGVMDDYVDNTILIRGNNTWVDDSKTDTWDKIDSRNFDKELEYLKKLISSIISQYSAKNDFQYSLTGKDTFNSIGNKKYRTLESEYFTILFDSSYESTIAQQSFLKECDQVYKRILAYNYYPEIKGKPILIFSQDTLSAAKIGERKDVYESGHDVGGGFSSFPSASVNVIFCKGPSLYTLSHELNHLLAGKRLAGKFSFSANEEAQGQTYNIFYKNLTFLADANQVQEIINMSDPSIANKDQIYVAKTYKDAFSWDWFINPQINPYKHQNSYFTLGSMYSFIYYNYGPNTARRAIYRVYEAKTGSDISKALIYDTALSESEFLEEWSEWVKSSGTDMVDKELFDISAYIDKINEYDIKWNNDVLKKDLEYKENYQPSTTETVLVNNSEVNDTDNIEYSTMDDASDDNVVYTPVTGYKYQVLLGEHLDQIYIKISFDIENREPEIAIFLQGDAPGLKLIIPYAYNKGTIIFKIKKKTALTFSAGIAINLGNRDFIYLSKQTVDNLSK